MTTAKLKSDLFRYIEEIDDKNILTALRSLLGTKAKKRRKDFWDDLTEEEKKEILQAIADLDSGKHFSFDQLISKHRKK